MTNKLIADRKRTGERSPKDPHVCCIWANERLHPDLVGKAEWVVNTGPNRDQFPIVLEDIASGRRSR